MKTLAAALATSLARIRLGVPVLVSAQDSTADLTATSASTTSFRPSGS